MDDEAERMQLKREPTAFVLEPKQVDHLRDAARRILTKDKEFPQLVRDLQ